MWQHYYGNTAPSKVKNLIGAQWIELWENVTEKIIPRSLLYSRPRGRKNRVRVNAWNLFLHLVQIARLETQTIVRKTDRHSDLVSNMLCLRKPFESFHANFRQCYRVEFFLQRYDEQNFSFISFSLTRIIQLILKWFNPIFYIALSLSLSLSLRVCSRARVNSTTGKLTSSFFFNYIYVWFIWLYITFTWDTRSVSLLVFVEKVSICNH